MVTFLAVNKKKRERREPYGTAAFERSSLTLRSSLIPPRVPFSSDLEELQLVVADGEVGRSLQNKQL